MTTLTITKARQTLGKWLKKATSGEDIGIVCEDRIVVLRPVQIDIADEPEAPSRVRERKEKRRVVPRLGGRLAHLQGCLELPRTRKDSFRETIQAHNWRE